MTIDLMWQDEKTPINNHHFWLMLIDKQSVIGKKLTKLEQQKRIKQGSLDMVRTSGYFTDEQKFDLSITTTLQEVLFKIDRIQQCTAMLDFYPKDIRTSWYTPMTRGEYLEQVMELYIMHSLGLVDRVLILYDQLFDLKLKRRERTVDNIIKSLSEEDGFPLFAFSKVFSAVKESRNLITHEYRYIDSDLIDLTLEDSFARDEYRASMTEAQSLFKELNKRYDKKARQLRKNMIENDQVLTEYFLPLMDVFERQYQKRLAEINQ